MQIILQLYQLKYYARIGEMSLEKMKIAHNIHIDHLTSLFKQEIISIK
jgi:hypothetical protein